MRVTAAGVFDDLDRSVEADEHLAGRCTATTLLITAACIVDVVNRARRIHDASLRPGAPFLQISARTLPSPAAMFETTCAELFGAAAGGTLLITEVQDMAPIVQARFIHTLADLQGRRDTAYAVRLMAGTTRSLWHHVEDGTFAAQLFYRLNVLHILQGYGDDVIGPPITVRPATLDIR